MGLEKIDPKGGAPTGRFSNCRQLEPVLHGALPGAANPNRTREKGRGRPEARKQEKRLVFST